MRDTGGSDNTSGIRSRGYKIRLGQLRNGDRIWLARCVRQVLHLVDKSGELSVDDMAKALDLRAWAYNTLGQYARAIEDDDQAIKLKPDYAASLRSRGSSYAGIGNTPVRFRISTGGSR